MRFQGFRLFAALVLVIASTASAFAQQPTGDAALKRLVDGNKRYVNGTTRSFTRAADRPAALNKGQAPFAMILGCADSRVAPELAFDQPWGSLFTVRVAGNFADPYLLGSLEYAVLTFHTPLLVVLGHDSCGAVEAARANANVTGNLKRVVDELIPAVKGTASDAAGVDANVRYVIKQVQANSPVLAEAIKAGKVKIVGGVYTFKTGQVRWLK